MAKAGRKYRLVIYEYMLNRWWPVTLLMALCIFLNVGVLWGAEWYFSAPGQNPLPTISSSNGTVMLAIGVISLLFSFFLIFTRKGAYVQLFDDHLRMVTPFFRLNVSYKRIQKSTTAQLFNLFPPKSLSMWKRDLIEPISGRTVVVVHLTAYPLSRFILRMFLSPFFFYDNSSHFVLMVDDWMSFNTDLDSRRFAAKSPRQPPSSPKPPSARTRSGLLDDLKRE
jgi:hypothetical protein